MVTRRAQPGLRVAYVTDQWLPQPKTDTQQILQVVSSLGRVGLQVELVVPRPRLRAPVSVETLAAHYGVGPTFGVRPVSSVYPSLRGLEKVAQGLVGAVLARPARYDLLYSRNLPVVVAALLWGRLPVVYETYRPWPQQKPWSREVFRWIGNHPRFLGAVLHSRLARDSYASAGVPPERLLVAHNGHAPERLVPVLSRAEARARLGIPVDARVAVYTGDIHASKGIDSLLDLARRLAAVRFLLVGSDGEGRVERRARRLPNVTVVGRQPPASLRAYWYAADVLLIPPTAGPLRRAGHTVLPIKTFEYMATGRPIFGPDTADLREVLCHGHSAVLAPPDDPREAARRLGRLLDDPQEAARLAEAARAEAAERTWDHRAQRIRGFLERRLEPAASGGPRGGGGRG